MAETATAMQLDAEAHHQREEQERRAKRKAGKMSKSDAQREKDRKSKEYRQKILQQHGHASDGPASQKLKRSSSGSSKQLSGPQSSAFQELFAQRAQGFQIDFRFRNAPPRPPVGPTFVGDSLDAVLLQQTSRQYKPLNAVEAGHVWKLHCEPDLGVPLAPSAMDLAAYSNKGRDDDDGNDGATNPLHPDDLALLDWKGSMGDTAADQRQVRQEQARAAARQWLQGGGVGPNSNTRAQNSAQKNKKKAFSRVLKEDMQTWMKKTTYLSNDYSRKVHDFKSLAQTKQELAVDLQAKQEEMAQRREVQAVQASFEAHDKATLQHPTNKKLKPVSVLPLLPHVANWGRAFTHVVIDKAPNLTNSSYTMKDIAAGAFVANVERGGPTERMSCQLMAAKTPADVVDDSKEHLIAPVQTFDLDVVPLKDEDSPHSNFCLWVDKNKGIATYLPISSRIQLATGRPVRKGKAVALERRPLTLNEEREMEERMAEVDREMADKHSIITTTKTSKTSVSKRRDVDGDRAPTKDTSDDDGEGDFGDDDSDSDDEQVFGGGTKTIVAED